MGRVKFEVPHGLSKDEAKGRLQKLAQDWGTKYGIQSRWDGDRASVQGKVMGISFDAILEVTDAQVRADASDPGFLFREKAKRFLQEKVALALDPKGPQGLG